MPQDTSRTTPRPATRERTAAKRPPAPPVDQLDALIGMLIEAARFQHLLLGNEARTFDYDAARDRFRRIARSRNAAVSRKYRAIARRGIGAPAADPQAHPQLGSSKGARSAPRPDPCMEDGPPF